MSGAGSSGIGTIRLQVEQRESNVLLGDDDDVWPWLRAVCFDEEVREMEEKEKTVVGNSGVRLSGGQAARLALARTLCHGKPVLVLDDPFSALDEAWQKNRYLSM